MGCPEGRVLMLSEPRLVVAAMSSQYLRCSQVRWIAITLSSGRGYSTSLIYSIVHGSSNRSRGPGGAKGCQSVFRDVPLLAIRSDRMSHGSFRSHHLCQIAR